MIRKNLTNILLVAVLVLLGFILFRGKITAYFKTREILGRASVYNIPSVAEACYYYLRDERNDDGQDCEEMKDEYYSKVGVWNGLIRQNKDLDCKDFESGRDARDFFHYISGELAKGIEETTNANGDVVVRLTFNDAFPALHCSYDPYELDTNGDCNACESYR